MKSSLLFSGIFFWGLCLFAAGNLVKEEFEIFCVFVWSLWGTQNRFNFESKSILVKTLVEDVGRFLFEFQNNALMQHGR